MTFDTAQLEAAESLISYRAARWLVPLTYIVCTVAFISDLMRSNELAYGVVYVPLIATALVHRRRWGLWVLTSVAVTLVVTGAFLPVVDPDLPDLVGNRVLSILAILATAAFVRHARAIQDRLALQTRRAERAEQVKAEVLDNLTHEMRTPLHTLLGLLSLMLVGCRPDQKQALRRIQAGGKQLLSTIDNLVDLTQFNERKLHRQSVDLAAVVRDAAKSANRIAEEAGVTISVDDGGVGVSAVGDAWATRRILDNLIANAVRFTPPGGKISLGVDCGIDQVIATVNDTGRGLPPGLAQSLSSNVVANDETQPGPNGAGLTLSNRLAKAMDGALVLESLPGSGARVSLRLPAAVKATA